MAASGGAPILGRGASETSGEGGRAVEEQLGMVLARGIGRGRSVAGEC